MKKFLLNILLLLVFSSFIQKDQKAKEIIDRVVENYGGQKFEKFEVTFTFRSFKYSIKHDNGLFHYQRNFTDKDGQSIEDVLTNKGFSRKINNKIQNLNQKDTNRFSESVNSVVYFVLLPHKLKDQAVNYQYIGETEINQEKYHKIKVWFNQEGGGRDYNDIFCYWFNQKTNTLDYLAYKNGGARFRKAFNKKNYNGLTFQDYENYEHKDTIISVTEYDQIFKEGKMKLLSKIEQTEIEVKLKDSRIERFFYKLITIIFLIFNTYLFLSFYLFIFLLKNPCIPITIGSRICS